MAVRTIEFKQQCSERAKKQWESESFRKSRTAFLTGRKLSDSTKEKISLANKGQVPWIKGKHHSEESKDKLRKNSHGFTDEMRKKIAETKKNNPKPFTVEALQNMSIAQKGKKRSAETIAKIANANRGKKRSPESCKKMSEKAMGRVRSSETKKKMSVSRKKMFLDPVYVSKMNKAWGIKPNKPEIFLTNLLNDLYPNEWKYTGDFSFMINGKCPDFVNCNGQKKIIEIFGDYWHKGQNPQDRIDIFKPYGYDTLVIWEHELKDIEGVIVKIKEFHNSKLVK